MIMIGFGQYFEKIFFVWSRFGPAQIPPLGGGGKRDRLTVTNLKALFFNKNTIYLSYFHFYGSYGREFFYRQIALDLKSVPDT